MFPSGSLVDRMMNFVKPWLTFIESRSDWLGMTGRHRLVASSGLLF
jgi:hypothetical protein